jgi:hypothetical protein
MNSRYSSFNKKGSKFADNDYYNRRYVPSEESDPTKIGVQAMDGKQYFTSFGICSTNGNAKLKSNNYYKAYLDAKSRRSSSIDHQDFLPYKS